MSNLFLIFAAVYSFLSLIQAVNSLWRWSKSPRHFLLAFFVPPAICGMLGFFSTGEVRDLVQGIIAAYMFYAIAGMLLFFYFINKRGLLGASKAIFDFRISYDDPERRYSVTNNQDQTLNVYDSKIVIITQGLGKNNEETMEFSDIDIMRVKDFDFVGNEYGRMEFEANGQVVAFPFGMDNKEVENIRGFLEKKLQEEEKNEKESAAARDMGNIGIARELEKLVALKEKGYLTEEEFKKQKARLMT